MNIKIENCIITSDMNNWIVDVCKETDGADKATKEKTEYSKVKRVYPATLQQAFRFVMMQCVKESSVEDIKGLIEVINSVEKKIMEIK